MMFYLLSSDQSTYDNADSDKVKSNLSEPGYGLLSDSVSHVSIDGVEC